MSRFVYTQEMLDFIEESFKEVSIQEVRSRFFVRFGIDKSFEAIKSCITNHNFKCGRKTGEINKGKLKQYTAEQKRWIEKNYKVYSLKELREEFNKKFNQNKTLTSIRAFTRNHGIKSGRTGRFDKGHVPHPNARPKGPNKTSFKKGSTPINHKPIGWERTTKDGAVMVKVAEPNKFRLKNRVVWESHKGEIPENHVVLCRDGNPSNCHIDNLVVFSRSELLRLNKMGHKEASSEIRPILRNLARIEAKAFKLENEL